MNIAIICPNFPPATFEGGISHYSDCLAQSLLDRGHKVFAFTSTEFVPPNIDIRKSNGVEIIRIRGPWNYLSIGKIKKSANAKQIDALILQYAPAVFKHSFRVKWALSRFSCQKITAFHTLWGKGIDRLLGLLILWGSSKIIATNSEILNILKKRLPIFLKNTYWIPIASAIKRTHQQPAKELTQIPVISYFGMLYPGKGLYLILNILEELRKRGHRFAFKFIGGGIIYHDSFVTEFKSEIGKRNLGNMVETLGMLPAEEVSECLNQSRFVFLPYESGLSDRRSSLMTAIEHGKAVLTSPPVLKVPLFQNGVNILWPEENLTSKYVELIERMLVSDSLICNLENGAKKLSRSFSWEKIAAEYESVLSSTTPST